VADEGEDDGEGSGLLSRSERKRRAEALQRLGVHLTQLRPAQLLPLQLPLELLEAIAHARQLRSRAALARQRQYLGRLMRELDPLVVDRVLAGVTDPRNGKMRR
jgi:ribosome-associated protein